MLAGDRPPAPAYARTVDSAPAGEHVVFRAARWKQAAFACIALVFVVGATFLPPVLAWPCGLASVALALVLLMSVARPPRLTVDRTGMVQDHYPFRPKRFEFAECSAFNTCTDRTSRRMWVVFDYASYGHGRPRLAGIGGAMSGGSCALTTTYGLPAKDLASMLEHRRTALEQPHTG